MASCSSTLLKDMEEKFFLCSVCLDQFREPKQLPCLHRYCSDCLNTVIQASNDGTIKCPMCNQECVIPDNGADGFKTDFHMKSMLTFIQLEKSVEKTDLKKCVSCLEQTNVSAYCFKCRDFLCEECYDVHVSSKTFTDHNQHALRLDNIEAKNITMDKLAALTEDPRCDTHVKKEAHSFCSTCGNIPVCVACTYSRHKGHDLHDVTELAENERELLRPKLAELEMHKIKLYALAKKIKATRQQLNENVAKITEKLTNQYQQQAHVIKYKMDRRKRVCRMGFTDIEQRRKYKDKQINRNYEEEFKQLNNKYDDIRKTTKTKYDNERQEFKENCHDIEGKLFKEQGSLDSNFKNLTTAKELRTEEKRNELKEISDYCEQIIKRYENFSATTSSILAPKNGWTDVQCIPDVRAACEPLIEEMKKECPELESLSDIAISDITKVIVDDVTITVVDVEGIKAIGWRITGMTSSKGGNIVIVGFASSNEDSHITVINRKGEIQRRDKIKREKRHRLYPFRDCCYLSQFKVATVCIPDEIGIYDVCDGSYNRKNMSDVIGSWSDKRSVFCVTTDPVNNLIIVGTNSRYVYVFDDQLNYSHTITLPDVISKSYDITVHGGSLLICDHSGKRAYAVTMEGSASKLMYQFTKPDDLNHVDCRPIRVCTDKNGFIYMLWRTYISGKLRCSMVQYSQDGQQLLATRPVVKHAYCMVTVEVDESEHLLLATFESGKLYSHDLIVT